MINKQEIRDKMSERMRSYDMHARQLKSATACKELEQTEAYQQADRILCYWSLPDEVFTHEFVKRVSQEKQIYLPVVCENHLLIRHFCGEEQLVKGCSFSLLEPHEQAGEASIHDMDLVIVPGVAFDLSGGRLGRGKGYYDKLLATTSVYKIGLCFDFQLVDQIPCEKHDVQMNQIISG